MQTQSVTFGQSLGIRELEPNQTLNINQHARAWIVRSGSLELFSSRFDGDNAVGVRRHLRTILPGRAVFGLDLQSPSDPYGLVALVTKSTCVEEFDFANILNRKSLEDGVYETGDLQEWVMFIESMMSDHGEIPPNTTFVSQSGELGLGTQEVLGPANCQMLLVEVLEGDVRLLGKEEFVVPKGDSRILLVEGLWLKVNSEHAKMSVTLIERVVSVGDLLNGLTTLQKFFFRHLNLLAQQEEQNETDRRRLSDRLGKLQTDEAFHGLEQVLSPSEKFPLRDTPLLTVANAVGQVLGIKINDPANSEEMRRLAHPIEAIARASRCRWRSLVLGADWWKYDSGPLIGFLGEETRRPVALLPVNSGYDIVDSDDRLRRPLKPSDLDQLTQEAFMLYRFLPDKLNTVGGLLRFTMVGRYRDLWRVLLVGITVTLLGMLVPQMTALLVDTAIPSADRRLLLEMGVLLAIAALATAAFSYVQLMTTVRMSTDSEVVSQAAMWDRLLKLRPEFFRQFSAGDLQKRVDAVGEVLRELNSATIRPMISGVLALLNFCLLWYYSWELAKVAIWVGLAVLVLTLSISYFVRQASLVLHDLEGKFHGMVVQMIGGVAKIRTMGAEHRAYNHWLNKYSHELRVRRRIEGLRDIVTVFNLLIPTVALAFVFWKGAKLTVGLEFTDPKRLSIGDFLGFSSAFTLYLTGWTDVSNTLVGVLDSVVKGRRIRPLLLGEPEVADGATDPGRLKGNISFSGVCFRYRDDGPIILDDVSFEIQPGEFVAFVGPSGSGKSTILRLLLGFEQPQTGRICYDGQDLSGVDVLAVRRQIGTVLQNGRLNHGSILDNISNNSQITMAEAWDAVSDAGMSNDVGTMPMGLHTAVSEGGTNLSGGQRQRLLIARALVTKPKLVFFDEATSALDNKTQSIVSQSLDRRKVTRVVIAHRLSTIRNADKIVVLQGGRIVSIGKFDELLEQEGPFRDLVARQLV
jgi:ATP-binding cassette subfamily C protein